METPFVAVLVALMLKLALVARKNIKEFEPQQEAHLAAIAKVCGFAFAFDVDWASAFAACAERGYENRAGEAGELCVSRLHGLTLMRSVLLVLGGSFQFNQRVLRGWRSKRSVRQGFLSPEEDFFGCWSSEGGLDQ